MSTLKSMIKKCRSEEGVALALVLIMVIIISLFLVAVSFLTQSSNTILKQNVNVSTLRTNDVSVGINQMLTALNSGNKYGFGSSVNSGNNTCEKLPRTLNNGETVNAGVFQLLAISGVQTDSTNINIYCTEPSYSGDYEAPGDYILTGTSVSSIGVDGGLSIASSGLKNSLSLKSGIVNSSGAWNNVSYSNVPLQSPPTSYPVVSASANSQEITYVESFNFASLLTNPASLGSTVSISGLSSSAFNTSTTAEVVSADRSSTICAVRFIICLDYAWEFSIPNTTGASGNATGGSFTVVSNLVSLTQPNPLTSSCPASSLSVGCNCPPNYPANIPNPCTYLQASDLVPTGNSYLSNYLNRTASLLLPLPTDAATSSDSSGSCSGGKATMTPGIINDTLLSILNQETNTNKSACTITFGTGRYWFNSNNPWIISNNSVIIGGTANGSSDCNNSKSGVEFQFGGSTSSYINLTHGTMALCDINSSNSSSYGLPSNFVLPVIAAPLQGSASPYFWTDPGYPILTLNDGTSGNLVNAHFYGPVFAPGGYSSIALSASSSASAFDGGAVFRAMTLGGDLSNLSDGVSAAPPYNGSRVVQLRFYNTTTKQDIGVVQIAIDDSFGLNYGNNYKIISWSAAS